MSRGDKELREGKREGVENNTTEQALILKSDGASGHQWVRVPSLQDALLGLCIDTIAEAQGVNDLPWSMASKDRGKTRQHVIW